MLFSIDNLQKRYGALRALDGITVEIEEGSVGLLGPNGAGKSTLIKTLLGLLDSSGGTAEVLGHPVPRQTDRVRQLTGYMPEDDCYLPYMKAVDFVSLNGRLAGMPKTEAFQRAHRVLHYVGLGEARYRTLDGFSVGMKQRVKLAQSLVHGPKLLFLDEPTNGLDPQGRDEMLEIIEDIRQRGVNIVLSSHLLHEVEQVCDAVMMLNEGKLVHYGRIDALKAGDTRVVELKTRDQNDRLADMLVSQGWDVTERGLTVKVALAADERPRQLLEACVAEGVQLRHFMPEEVTLEAAFLDMLDDADQTGGPRL